jgi:hypothetical protein
VTGQNIKFCFNKYQVGRQIHFELNNLHAPLDSRIVSKNYKSNFATFTFKKQNPSKWRDLYSQEPVETQRDRVKSRSRPKQKLKPNMPEMYQNKDHLKELKKFTNSAKGHSRNQRYLPEDAQNVNDFMIMVPEEVYEGSERSLKVLKENGQGSIEDNINHILNKFDLIDSDKIHQDSFLKNEQNIKNNYLKALGSKQTANGQKSKLYQGKPVKDSNTYKGRYYEKSQNRKNRQKTFSSHSKPNSSNMVRNKSSKSSYQKSVNREEAEQSTKRAVSNRYKNLNSDSSNKRYKNSWLNNEVPDSKENISETVTPKNLSQKAFKDTSGHNLMTIDEIMALNAQDDKEVKPKKKRLPVKSRSKNSIERENSNKYKFGTMTAKEGNINKMMAMDKQYRTEYGHREKSMVEIERLKICRKSNEQIDISIDRGNDLNKESFVGLPSQNNSRPPSEPINESLVRSKKMINVKSDLKRSSNIFQEPFKPQSQSQLELGTSSVSKQSKPNQFASRREKTKTNSVRSRTNVRSTLGRSINKTDRGLSQNLSNLPAHTVVSYDGPNVSVISLKLRDKRQEILDTFASLNLDMAWIHRQCKYIDLHSTEGVLKFFELQNRLIKKLATKLRKEKNSRFVVEKQCEEMMDNMKSGFK